MKPESPSSTALLIAASTLFVRQDARRANLVSREAAELSTQFLRTAGRPASRVLDLVGKPWFRRLVGTIEDITIPGIQTHYVLRKRYLRDWTTSSIREGFSQIVSLGAGFDTLCLELHAQFPSAHFIEVDHPATQKVKRHALAAMGVTPQSVSFVPADLSATPLDEALADCASYAATNRTLFIAEGLLMYLEGDRVTRLLRHVARHGSNRVAFTFLEPRANGKPNFSTPSRLVDRWLNTRQERFQWGIRRTLLSHFLSSCGLRLAHVTDDHTFQRWLPAGATAGDVPKVGEYICVADSAGP